MIYLDNASTTKPTIEVINAMNEACLAFGNPSSLHNMGIAAEKIVEKSRDEIGQKLGVSKRQIFFTSGGTEANNTAILGYARANKKRGNHLITSKIEHPSVLESFKALEDEGFLVTYVNVTPEGIIDLEELKQAICEKTILVSVMLVNNETGIIQPVEKIKPMLSSASPICALHCDCVQAFGKLSFTASSIGADMISISAHKIHGPKGVGALYIKSDKISPIIHGGEQQRTIRPGTENVPGIAGFGATIKDECINCSDVYDELKTGIINNIPNVKINGGESCASKNVLNVSFLGLRAEVLLHTLEKYEIYVSTGSACSSHKPQPSHVLIAMGCKKPETEGAIRFSFSEDNTVEEMKTVVKILKKEVETLRKYM